MSIDQNDNLDRGLEAFENGVANYKKREYNIAKAFFDKAIDCGYNKDALSCRGDCLQEMGLYEDALVDFNNAILEQPNNCNLYFMRSNIEKKLDNIDCAIISLEIAIRISELSSELNRKYNAGAKEQGYESITKLYEDYLERALIEKASNFRKLK